jgi:hypothetical protein
MNATIRSLRNFLVSLKLTVVLLALSLVLIFAATLSQVNLGIWAVQQEFFHSFVAIWHVGSLYVPLPGGYLVGGLLLINLIAAHIYRFKLEGRKFGILIVHLGLILLLIGELVSGLWQEEYAMRVSEGETRNYSESYRRNELAIVDVTDPKTDNVVAIPEEFLAKGQPIQHPQLPFRVIIKQYFPNSTLHRSDEPNVPPAPVPATQGIGLNVSASGEPLTYKQDERNSPAAYIELVGPEGSIGTWLVAAYPKFPPQHFSFGGREWKIALRYERAYYPFSITLLDFSHDVYTGTDIPKNFSSRVRLNTQRAADDREVLIYMNNPLRFAGLTFYQSGYDGEQTTIFQVVRNPSWILPYIACGLMTFGLVIQFGIHLLGFIRKRRTALSVPA